MYLHSDFTTSVARAFDEIDADWADYPGHVICGSHTPHDVENLLTVIQSCIQTKTPLLGICFGHQLIAIQYARDVLGIPDATSEEFGTGTFVVKRRPELLVGLHGGESWWSDYELDVETYPQLTQAAEQPLVWSIPFHPEYQSWKKKPHPLLVDFLYHAKMAM